MLQLGLVWHTMSAPAPGTLTAVAGGSPDRLLTVHRTAFGYRGHVRPSAPSASPPSTATSPWG